MQAKVTFLVLMVVVWLVTSEGFGRRPGRGRINLPGRGPGRGGRRGRLVGGLIPVNTDDAEIIEKANFAVQELGSEYSLTQLNGAYTQVVAGMMYHLKMVVSKNSSLSVEPKTYSCNVKVHEQVWMNYTAVSEHCCNLQ